MSKWNLRIKWWSEVGNGLVCKGEGDNVNSSFQETPGPCFLEVQALYASQIESDFCVAWVKTCWNDETMRPGARADLGRPTTSTHQNKEPLPYPDDSSCIQIYPVFKILQGRSRAGIFITFHIYHILDWIVCCRSSKDAFMNHLRGREDILSFWVLMFNMSSVPSEQSLLASSHPETWHVNDYNILQCRLQQQTLAAKKQSVSQVIDAIHSN